MIEYLLQSFTPVSHVRRSLLIVIALGLIVIVFSADVSGFSFLGIQFTDKTVILVFGYLNFYYGCALMTKTIMLSISYLDKENEEIKNLSDRVIDRISHRNKTGGEISKKDFDLENVVIRGTERYFHRKRPVSFFFLLIELIIPIFIAFFISYILIFNTP